MKKTLTMSLAALGIAGMVGGGTFATWSDYAVENGGAGAGILELTLNNTSSGAGATESFGYGDLAPGVKKIQEVFVASSHADSVPQATLKLTLDNLVGEEDGCHGNSEKDDETTNGDTLCDSAAAPFVGGQFAEQAWIQIVKKAAASPTSCSGGSYGLVYVGTLDAAPGVYTLDSDTSPGEGYCLRMELGLPDGTPLTTSTGGIDFAGTADTDNAVQGDSATFDLTFDLVQNAN